ncbi:Fe-S cluster assembly protein SufB [Candidatus Woesearchaeota archaeon]|nr:Fe-S cluster assembly protein SufB [Candidatus Woesearchaeota archaeon]
MSTFQISREALDTYNPEKLRFKAEPGISEEIVREISRDKKEPDWMLKKRLEGYRAFLELEMPGWGPSLKNLDLSQIYFYMIPDAKQNATSWDEVPSDIKKTFERLGIPEAEKKALAGVGAQYESSVVYHKLKEEWEKQGVVFLDCDEAVKQYPELVKKYFMTSCVPIRLHKFSALHAAVWSGGTFIYIPKGVKLTTPLQAYFRMNAKKGGQFEHTLIIVDEGAEVHYIEGCSAPQYGSSSLHAGCVEIHVLRGARARYSSIENWSRNTFNLNTKRAVVYDDGIIEWVNGNMGCLTGDSKVITTLKGPVPIQSIVPGDEVVCWDKETNTLCKSKVVDKIFSGEKEVFTVEAGGRSIKASGNHPFLTLVRKKNKPNHKKGFFHFQWKKLEEFVKGEVIAVARQFPIDGKEKLLPLMRYGGQVKSKNQYGAFNMPTKHLYQQGLIFPEKTDEDFMWLMGLLLGDGHIDKVHNKINLATHEREDYREKVCQVVKKLFNYTIREKKERFIIINSKMLAYSFFDLGFGGTAQLKRIPSWVFGLPKKQILSLLAGYFDADGHVAGSAIAFTSISRALLEDVAFLGMQVGFGVSRIFSHRLGGNVIILGNPCQSNDSFRVLFNGPYIKDFPSRCERKREKIKKIRSNIGFFGSNGLNFSSKTNKEIGFARIEKITSMGIMPTFDIEIEKYNNFIANGLIVHNSCVTMLYPASMLIGDRAKANFIGIAYAGKGQNQDTGSKIVHLGKQTSSNVQSKSISKDGGITTYRGLISVKKGAANTTSNVNCDALMMDSRSQSNTIPYMDVKEPTTDLAHEATVGKISEDQVFYLMSRGIGEEAATQMIVSGFIEPVVKELPLEYAVELNRLIQLEMEGSLG